ncbi:hypothetical protein D3C76_423800 [compost metagenome]|jgi:hypothetical protein|uniref:DUF4440 domain-containing protein n=1 Tax=Pseudomonas fluorescens TaxID=294 RepID=A0A5E7RKJ6_PSEFL|nr:nuclear transport factor 2 family protein [Pseudomonas fluorescens]VVP75061.1 hypothetical protein PS938_00139 [Pseudomonas fluorescens]
MTNTASLTSESSKIFQVLSAYHAAMVEADTIELEHLLEVDYSLVHITGYLQPKQEWLDLVVSGNFNYHRIELDQNSLEISVAGINATVKGRGIFDATINGMNAPWKLKFSLQLRKHGDHWKLAKAHYATFG